MARLARVVVPGLPHHITQWGNRRQQTFFCDEDYRSYLELMGQWCGAHHFDIWAYCRMPNYVHLIAGGWKRGRAGNRDAGLETGTHLVIDKSCVPVSAPTNRAADQGCVLGSSTGNPSAAAVFRAASADTSISDGIFARTSSAAASCTAS